MKVSNLMLFAVVLTALVGCEKKPSADAWTAELTAIETLNGTTASFVLPNGSRLSGMRVGSQLPAGTRIETQPGVLVKLKTNDAGEIALEGGAALELDQYAPRTVRLLRGRAVLTASVKEAGVSLGEHTVRFDDLVAVEASGETSSIAVLDGSAKIGDDEVAASQVVHIAGDNVRLAPAFDVHDRAAWTAPRKATSTAGYGVVGNKMTLIDHLVDVKIAHTVATTTVTESFRNDHDVIRDLRYSFQFPGDAVLSKVEVQDDDGEWMSSAVEMREMAARTYRYARDEGRAAVLMSAEGRTVNVQIANVHPKTERRIRITYLQPMRPTVGGARYLYEMPRDHSGTLQAQRFRIDIEAAGVAPKDVSVFGYGATVRAADGGIAASFEAGDFVPTGDLSVVLADDAPVRVSVTERGDERFYSVAFRPHADVAAREPADVLVVVDTSGSRKRRASGLSELVEALLEQLPDDDHVMVATCAARCAPFIGDAFGPKPQPKKLTIEMFEGVTNLTEVGTFAKRQFQAAAAGRERHVVLLTDGVATAGALDASTLATDLGAVGARLHAVDVSAQPPTAELTLVANAGGGDAITAELQRPWLDALRIVAALSTPPVTQASVELPDGLENALPHLPPTPAGSMLRVLVRAPKTTMLERLKLTGTVAGEVRTWQPSLGAVIETNGVAQLWAAARVRALEAWGDPPAMKQAAVLAREFEILSRQTSLVAVGKPAAPAPSVAHNSPSIRSDAPKAIETLGNLAGRGGGSLSQQGLGLANVGRGGGGRGGSGYGRGPGNLGERRARVPRIVPGRPVVRGSLDKEVIRRVVRQHRRELKYCYEVAAQRTPNLGGRLVVRFTISARGSVVSAVIKESNLASSEMERCVTGKVRRWVFPEPLGGGIVIVNYPFNFADGSPLSVSASKDSLEGLPTAQTVTVQDAVTFEDGATLSRAKFEALVRFRASLHGMSAFDESIALGRPITSSAPRDVPIKPALFGREDRASALMFELPEQLERADAELHDMLAELHTDVALACAHRQAAASLRGQTIPKCPSTSASVSAEAEDKSIGDSGLVVRLEGPRSARLMLVRSNGQRRWWLEPWSGTHCRRDPSDDGSSAIETCQFDQLPGDLYALRVVRAGESSEPVRVTVKRGTEESSYEVEGDDGFVTAFTRGAVTLHAPEITVPAVEMRRALAAFRPAAHFCALLADRPLHGFETHLTLPEVDVKAVPDDERATHCMIAYLSQVEAREEMTVGHRVFKVSSVDWELDRHPHR